MKKLILLSALSLFLISLLLNVSSAAGLQQVQNSTDDVALLKKTNASLKSQLVKQRTTFSKQMQHNDSSIAKLRAVNDRQQAAISNLQATLNSQQTAIDKMPTAINQRSHVFGRKRMLAIGLIVAAFLLVIVYIVFLRRKVQAFNDNLEKVEEGLAQKLMKENMENREFLVKEASDLRMMLERQTTENKNRMLSLLADTNQLVHKMGDEVNKTFDQKINAFRSEVTSSITLLNERLSNPSTNKSL